jgi:hypothetical protein
MWEQWKCFSANNFRLICNKQLVHLLVCSTQWIFKMHGATIKIKKVISIVWQNIVKSYSCLLCSHITLDPKEPCGIVPRPCSEVIQQMYTKPIAAVLFVCPHTFQTFITAAYIACIIYERIHAKPIQKWIKWPEYSRDLELQKKYQRANWLRHRLW